MCPSFWQSKNKRFLIFKPGQVAPFEEKRLSLLQDARNIYINDTSLYELLVYHAGLNPEQLSEETIDTYLKENIRYATISAIFQGFLFHNMPLNLKQAYAEKVSHLLFQEGLMFAATRVLPMLSQAFIQEGYQIKAEDIKAAVHLVGTEDGHILIQETCTVNRAKNMKTKAVISGADDIPLIAIEHAFQLKPQFDGDEPNALTWEHIDCTVETKEALVIHTLNKGSMLEKIKHFIETTLEEHPLAPTTSITAKS